METIFTHANIILEITIFAAATSVHLILFKSSLKQFITEHRWRKSECQRSLYWSYIPLMMMNVLFVVSNIVQFILIIQQI